MTAQISETEDVASVSPPFPDDFENPQAAIIQVFPVEGSPGRIDGEPRQESP